VIFLILRKHWLFGVLLLALIGLCLATLQQIPNGSDHYFMIDVGETQIVLNVWGTLHSTGYPLYIIFSALMVEVMTLFGVSAVTAPAVTSLIWGVIMFVLLYVLAYHLTQRPMLSAVMVAVYGLTRTIWIHNVMAEIYSFGMVTVLILLLLALWRGDIRHRIYWLALVGGIAVGNHRAVLMMIPALLYAVAGDFRQVIVQKRLIRVLLVSMVIGLAGMLQYIYLMIRAWADAPWVYGEPGTLSGLWDQIIGAEASQFIGVPTSVQENFELVNRVLVTDLTLPGVIVGVIGLLVALRAGPLRRASITFILMALGSYGFHVAFYSDVLSALILPITVSLAFGWLFLGEWVLSLAKGREKAAFVGVVIAAVALSVFLFQLNYPFIHGLVTDPRGEETIALAKEVPPGSTLMIAWGMRHFAVGVAQDVLGELADIRLVDHKADFAEIIQNERLITPAYTFYDRPLAWWEDATQGPVYLQAAGVDLVALSATPELLPEDETLQPGVSVISAGLECRTDEAVLTVDWVVDETPNVNLSVFVHLLNADGEIIAQADQSAPVYGWRPLTTWQAREVVRDLYALPVLAEGASLRYGFYQQLLNGQFDNVYVFERDFDCAGASAQ
jgi:hypothetical protein